MLKLQQKFADNPKRRTFASIDLSAATDRLPISLQASVLRVLLKDIVPDSTMFAKAWIDLLVDRHYKISISGKLNQEAIVPRKLGQSVKYSVGQPMGALSS
jgi:hypothetical protein